jgi:hypothetical protein
VRRALLLIVLGGLVVGATALAQSGGETGTPVVRDGAVLHLPGGRPCSGRQTVTLRVTPPAELQMGWVSVQVNGREVARLTGIASAASATVRLPKRATRVVASAETLDGQQLVRERHYDRCAVPVVRPRPKPKPQPAPAPTPPGTVVGGPEA